MVTEDNGLQIFRVWVSKQIINTWSNCCFEVLESLRNTKSGSIIIKVDFEEYKDLIDITYTIEKSKKKKKKS